MLLHGRLGSQHQRMCEENLDSLHFENILDILYKYFFVLQSCSETQSAQECSQSYVSYLLMKG